MVDSMRPRQESKERVLHDLAELYACRPTKAIFDRTWHPDAVFEDPLVKAEGSTQYEAQWFAMPRLFSKSRQISRRVILTTETPNRLVYAQVQEYTVRCLDKTQRIESVVELELDESDRIVRMVDKWNGEDLAAHYGADWFRWLNARVTPWLVRVPKE